MIDGHSLAATLFPGLFSLTSGTGRTGRASEGKEPENEVAFAAVTWALHNEENNYLQYQCGFLAANSMKPAP